tara:strand:+ start:110 stop:241 length:132 start_codon:yes stop_codon:yes gene_type:complete
MILFTAMDYLVGFIIGYICKEVLTFIKDIANGDFFEHDYEENY